MNTLRRHLTALILLLAASGCGDDATSPRGGAPGALTGTVVDGSTGQGVEGAPVVVLTDAFAVTAVVSAGADGAFTAPDLPAGDYLVYALDENHRAAADHQARVRVRAGQTTEIHIRLVPDAEVSLLTYRVAGRITRADTGAPLPGAWIMAIGYGEAGNSVRYLTRNTSLFAAVSDADGHYSLPVWPVRESYPDGPVIGIGPLSCSAIGFRPRTFVGPGPSIAHESWLQGGLLPAPADSVLDLDVALLPVPAGGLPPDRTGIVRGRVVAAGIGTGGVMVHATLITLADPDTVWTGDKVAITGGSVRTGEGGAFEMTLEPGHYALRAGLLPDDGWCRDGGPGMIEVQAGRTLEVGDIGVFPAVAPVSPARGATTSDPPTTFAWTSVPGADRYEFQLNVASLGTFEAVTTDTFLTLAEEIRVLLTEGRHSWNVNAERQFEPPAYTRIAWFEVPAPFTVTAGP